MKIMTITLFVLLVALGIFSIKLVTSYKCEEVLNNSLRNAIIYSLSETSNKSTRPTVLQPF